jgi:succinyl-diaminopimelate desuccinylase
MADSKTAARAAFLADAATRRDQIVSNARALLAAPSPNPPLSTQAVAAVAEDLLRKHAPEVELSLHDAGEGVVNLVARVKGNGLGPRPVMSGHLDTYPVNVALPWTVDPFGGELREGRLHGRGAADMKGNRRLDDRARITRGASRDVAGEAVLALAGDEESMGERGTQWLIDNVPHVTGDAVIVGDAGSPWVVRFGEKGFLWIELEARGKPAHGAHVHLGINAIDRLRGTLDALAGLREMAVPGPDEVTRAIAAAQPVSEPLSGAGESQTLTRATVNIGHIAGGSSMNLIPASARAGVDIRIPVGVPASVVEEQFSAALVGMEGVSWRVLRRYEASFTPTDAHRTALNRRLSGAPSSPRPRLCFLSLTSRLLRPTNR